jgi:hypothetical protein
VHIGIINARATRKASNTALEGSVTWWRKILKLKTKIVRVLSLEKQLERYHIQRLVLQPPGDCVTFTVGLNCLLFFGGGDFLPATR